MAHERAANVQKGDARYRPQCTKHAINGFALPSLKATDAF